jgi:hypothetical protein
MGVIRHWAAPQLAQQLRDMKTPAHNPKGSIGRLWSREQIP